MRIRSTRLAYFLLLPVLGCAPAGETAEPPSCDQVCANIVTQCGASAPGCAGACASFDDATRSCVAAASSCGAAEACVSEGPGDAGGPTDSGSMTDAYTPDPNPCSACTRLQYCVRDPGVSAIRCWDPPETCDGAPPVDCDVCFYAAGIGPCASGARGCSSGAAGRTIDCQ